MNITKALVLGLLSYSVKDSIAQPVRNRVLGPTTECVVTGGQKSDTVVVIDFPKEVDDCLTAAEEKDLREKKTTWNVVWKRLKKDCKNVEEHDNGATLYNLYVYPKAIKVHSKKDMNDKLVKYANDNNCCIKKLRISGHGAAGDFSVGGGKKSPPCKYVNGNQAEWKKAFTGLKSKLCTGAKIIIQACSTGAGETGKKKMEELSEYFEAEIVAPTEECSAFPTVEDLPSNKKREIPYPPPPPKTVTPPPGEEDMIDESTADDLISNMTQIGSGPWNGTLVSIGVYCPELEMLPDLSANPTLPINDPQILYELQTGFSSQLAFTDTVPHTYKASSLVIVQYDNGSYDMVNTILGNRLLMTSDIDGFMLLYPLSASVQPLLHVYPCARGDPHFKTWSGEKYDFHGVCDLVLLTNVKFHNGLGMDIHIRTKQTRVWSYIATAAIRIGDDTFEVAGGKDENRYWVNKIKGDPKLPSSGETITTLSSERFPVVFHQLSEKARQFDVILSGNDVENDASVTQKILFKTWNGMVSVSIEGASYENFGTSAGLMGAFDGGYKIGRNNTSSPFANNHNDINNFGQEWQVLPTEPKLFHDNEGPQAPVRCIVPSASDMRRRLGESSISKVDAENACAHVQTTEDFDLCVFDVMATNDRDTAGAY